MKEVKIDPQEKAPDHQQNITDSCNDSKKVTKMQSPEKPVNPWGKPQSGAQAPIWGSPSSVPAPCSLEEVMSEELSEQLAKKLQLEEELSNAGPK